jgi:hypothetical protein
MEIFIKANGKMTKLMALEFIFMLMVHNIQVFGKMINKMEMGHKNGQMEVNIKDHINWVKKMVKASIYGQMEVITKVIGKITK